MNVLEAESGALFTALSGLLYDKGLLTPAELSERVAVTEQASPAQGARMVAKAWTDPEYRELMLRDGTAAAEAIGAFMRGSPPLGVLANEAGLHHLVVCTLCSCYPHAVLGIPPNWYKTAAYRSRAVRDPRGVSRVRRRHSRRRGGPCLGLDRRGPIPRATRAACWH